MRTVAVDILTGFLGSGKTTLLRHVLDHGLAGKPVAVIMNEIGEVGMKNSTVEELHAFMQGYNRALAALYISTGKKDLAEKHLRIAASHQPQRYRSQVALADFFMEQGRNAEARAALVPALGNAALDAAVKVRLASLDYDDGATDKARADLENARRVAAQGARQAFLGVNAGLAQVRALEAAEVSSKSALDSNRLGYQVGVRINIDVLNAQQQLYSTQRDLAKARYDTIVNGLRLKSAAGTLKEEDLVRINALLKH